MKQHDAKWNPKTQSGTYSDKIHWGELKINNPMTQPTPKRLTPLQEAIKELKRLASEEINKDAVSNYKIIFVIGLLESLISSEQALFEEIWEAGAQREHQNLRTEYNAPTKQQFLSQFKPQP